MQKRFQMPAMELTGEEFIVEIASNPFFSRNYEDLLRDFVDRETELSIPKKPLKAVKSTCYSIPLSFCQRYQQTNRGPGKGEG